MQRWPSPSSRDAPGCRASRRRRSSTGRSRWSPGAPSPRSTVDVREGETVAVSAVKRSVYGRGEHDKVRIEVTEGDPLRIETVHTGFNPRVSVEYTIHLPLTAVLRRVENSNGPIELSGVRVNGTELRTSNGPVRVDGAPGGDLAAASSNGGIEVRGAEGYVTARTSNAPITLRLAEELDARIVAITSNGRMQHFIRPGSTQRSNSHEPSTPPVPHRCRGDPCAPLAAVRQAFSMVGLSPGRIFPVQVKIATAGPLMNVGNPLAMSFSGTRNRTALIAGLTVLTLGGNLLGLVLGAPEGLLPLPALPLSIPIILASYWYPRRGIIFSVCLAAVYAVTVFLLSPSAPLFALTILPRAVFLVLVGGVVALLSTRLRDSGQQMNQNIEFLPDATFAIDREGRSSPGTARSKR